MADSVKEQYHTHISSKRSWHEINIKEVWQYRDLITLFTKRNFTIRYKQTVLGPAWLFLNPIIASMIYTFIFGSIAGIDTDDIPQLLFYMSSNAIWTFFASCVNKNATTFTSNANVFGKVYFPRLTIPVSNILSSSIEFLIQMIIIVVFLIFYLIRGDIQPNFIAWLLIPLILLHLGIMGMSIGIIISSLTTKYRDLTILVSFGVQLWMYVTPVVYPLSQASHNKYRLLLLINPVSAPVEMFRYAFLGHGTIVPWALIWSIIFTGIVAVFGVMIFNGVEKTFMDTV